MARPPRLQEVIVLRKCLVTPSPSFFLVVAFDTIDLPLIHNQAH